MLSGHTQEVFLIVIAKSQEASQFTEGPWEFPFFQGLEFAWGRDSLAISENMSAEFDLSDKQLGFPGVCHKLLFLEGLQNSAEIFFMICN